MTHFRFRCKCAGYLRWRSRAERRRVSVLAQPLLVEDAHLPSRPSWRRVVPLQVPPAMQPLVLHVGDFIVSQQGDPQLSGHPDIRY